VVSVTHVVSGLRPSEGGPSRTVVQICDTLAKDPLLDISLLYQDKIDENSVNSKNHRVKRYPAKSNSEVALKFGIPGMLLLKDLSKQKPSDIYHLHGIWSPVLHWAMQSAQRKQKIIILQPRGMLEPWALSYKNWKKTLGLKLYQQRDLVSASLFIATSEQEAKSIRRVGLKQPIAVIPNGIELAIPSSRSDLQRSKHAIRTVLFLSRIHPKKGLVNLIKAWAKLQPINWRLVIAGPDEGGHLAEVISAARKNGVSDAIDYLGEVEGELKASIYQNADLFVLPTFSENFGVVVLEALAHGLPVITTRGAPWQDLESYRCGWWIDTGVEPLISALREAILLTDLERIAMGLRGREYVRRYDWDAIARQTAEVYRWVLNQGDKPECVITD